MQTQAEEAKEQEVPLLPNPVVVSASARALGMEALSHPLAAWRWPSAADLQGGEPGEGEELALELRTRSGSRLLARLEGEPRPEGAAGEGLSCLLESAPGGLRHRVLLRHGGSREAATWRLEVFAGPVAVAGAAARGGSGEQVPAASGAAAAPPRPDRRVRQDATAPLPSALAYRVEVLAAPAAVRRNPPRDARFPRAFSAFSARGCTLRAPRVRMLPAPGAGAPPVALEAVVPGALAVALVPDEVGEPWTQLRRQPAPHAVEQEGGEAAAAGGGVGSGETEAQADGAGVAGGGEDGGGAIGEGGRGSVWKGSFRPRAGALYTVMAQFGLASGGGDENRDEGAAAAAGQFEGLLQYEGYQP